jgi:hypothetical protein
MIPNMRFGFSGRVLATFVEEKTSEVRIADTSTRMARNQNELNTLVQAEADTFTPDVNPCSIVPSAGRNPIMPTVSAVAVVFVGIPCRKLQGSGTRVRATRESGVILAHNSQRATEKIPKALLQ